MDYTDELTEDELMALQEEELLNSGEEVVYGNIANLEKVSLEDLRFGYNAEAFAILKDWIERKSIVSFNFGIDKGCPYYQINTTSTKQRLYLNKEIVRYLYNYFENGVLGLVRPSSYDGVRNATENYVLHLLKRDRQNGKMVYEPETGYRAEYIVPVNYGHLPYTSEELDAKLNSLA